jgi:DNA-binding PadR family transcriptional regulator
VSVAFALLSFLEGAPRHGYELKPEYDALFSAGKPLQFGQIYATLSRLERDGRIRLAAQEPGHGPERKCYEITDEGRADLAAWLAEPVVPDPLAQNALFAKTVLAMRSGRSADAYLDRQRARHLERMRELTALKRNGDLAATLVADHALFHLEADLRWIDHAGARLDDHHPNQHRGS